MKVETYECTETREETSEQTAEALQLIEQLGLEGQRPVQKDDSTGVRNPYRIIRADEDFVYRTLCPQREAVEKFKAEPIPLEVLKTLAYAKSLNIFAYFEVWSAASATVKDPVLVGYLSKSQYGSPVGEPYIIARWANELLPLEVLLPDALKKWHAIRMTKLRVIQVKVEQALLASAPDGIPTDRSEPYAYL